MKTTFFAICFILLLCLSTYAGEGPTFVKIGSTYALTANTGVGVPHIVTITGSGGNGWFQVTTPGDTGPNAHPVTGLGQRWINFSQLVEVRETTPVKGPK
jgi:hypothetical protein